MGSRYYLTGVQLGMLMAFIETRQHKKLQELIDKIGREQMMFIVSQDGAHIVPKWETVMQKVVDGQPIET